MMVFKWSESDKAYISYKWFQCGNIDLELKILLHDGTVYCPEKPLDLLYKARSIKFNKLSTVKVINDEVIIYS